MSWVSKEEHSKKVTTVQCDQGRVVMSNNGWKDGETVLLLQWHHEIGTIAIPILMMKKRRHREVQYPATSGASYSKKQAITFINVLKALKLFNCFFLYDPLQNTRWKTSCPEVDDLLYDGSTAVFFLCNQHDHL